MNKDLTAAGATPLILALLAHREDYGYALISRIRQHSDSLLDWPEGMIYPILHRLEHQSCLASRTVELDNGRKRKYYRTTAKGLAYLQELRSDWQRMERILDHSLRQIERPPSGCIGSGKL